MNELTIEQLQKISWQREDDLAMYLSPCVKARPEKLHEIGRIIREFKDDMELTDEGPALKQARIDYLTDKVTNLSSHEKVMNAHIQRLEDRDTDSWVIDTYKHLNGYEKLTGSIRSIKITIAHLNGLYKSKKSVVTDDMIAVAKKAPWDNLLKTEIIGGRKRCPCPFHNEKNPSFYIYPDTNRGHCHGCGRNVDTIQFMVEKKKVDFNEAVRMLVTY